MSHEPIAITERNQEPQRDFLNPVVVGGSWLASWSVSIFDNNGGIRN